MDNKVIKGVYCLTFPNGKRYVGRSVGKLGIKHRWKAYQNVNCKTQTKLYRALKKYGPENVKFEVLVETDDKDRADKIEIQLIALWNLTNIKYGYNICAGGGGHIGSKYWLGRHHSEESKNKISNSHKGKKKSAEHLIKHAAAMRGKYVSEETRQKLRDATTKYWQRMRESKEQGVSNGL
jgi:group I intron endonuclease